MWAGQDLGSAGLALVWAVPVWDLPGLGLVCSWTVLALSWPRPGWAVLSLSLSELVLVWAGPGRVWDGNGLAMVCKFASHALAMG